MTVTIISHQNKPFTKDDGSKIPYVWYKARRADTGAIIQFGSTDETHKDGELLDLDIDLYEGRGGQGIYKETIKITPNL